MKNDKRNIAMEIIVLIVLFILLVIVRLNHNIWIGDYEYLLLNDKGTAQIVGYRGNGENVIVPSKIGPIKIGIVRDETFEGNKSIRKVIVNKGNSGESVSFRNCENLETVICEKDVTSLKYIFIGCKKLSEVVLPDGLQVIEDSAFEGCNSLEDIYIPNTVTDIGARTFKGTLYEQEHTKDKYYVVGEGCLIFCNVTQEEDIIIPTGVRKVCASLRSGNGSVIYVPDNIAFERFAQISGDEIFFGEGDYSDVSYTMSSTVVAPKESPLAKDCQKNGVNFRPITEEEDAVRREKTEAAAADVVYQDE